MEEATKNFSFKHFIARSQNRMNLLTKVLSLGFGIILISWLLAQLDMEHAIKIIREVPVYLLLLGFIAYLLAFYLRAVRFKLLFPATDQNIRHLFPIVLVHYTALNIIPARLGEFSYIYLLKKVNHISTGCSVSNLLIARVFDHITISLLFLISTLFLQISSPWFRMTSVGVCAFLILTLLFLMLMLAYKEKCVFWLQKSLRFFHLEKYALIQRIMQEMEEILKAFQHIQMKQHAGKVLGISLLIWICIFGSNYFLLHAFQVPLAYLEVIMASTCIILLRFLPLQLVSGIGIHETSWVVIATALGVPKDIAITSAFGSHILGIVFLVLLGGYGLLRLQRVLHDSEER